MADYNVDDVLRNIFDISNSEWKPSDKIPAINKEIEILKNDLKSYLNTIDFDLFEVMKESEELSKEGKLLVMDMENCKKEIEEETMTEILRSVENYDVLTKELQCVKFGSNVLYDVVQCGKYVKEFIDGRESQSFTRSVEAVLDLLQLLEIPADGFTELDFCAQITHTAQLILDSIVDDMYEEWNRLVQWSTNTVERKTTVTLTLKLSDTIQCVDILNALDKSEKLLKKVAEFADILLTDILVPIIHSESLVAADTECEMTVTTPSIPGIKPPYNTVMARLKLVFLFLSDKLNFEFKRGTSLMTMVGKEIGAKFASVLTNDCLIDTIPHDINELQSYSTITNEVEEFQRLLFFIRFFHADSKISVLSYISDIDILFAYKSSQHYLQTAREIMLKDLSPMMSIGVNNIADQGEVPSSSTIGGLKDALEILENTIPKSLFYFPRCMMSKTTQELLDLVSEMMEQAVQCSDVVCKKIYNTSRLIFELYDAVVPYHHEDFLQNIPQYVALFHNNCMYLAHNLLTLGDRWLLLMEGRDVDLSISFVDIVQKLRDLGYKHITIHMQQQRKQILDNIRTSDLNCIMVKDVLSENAEAAVRQCLRQMQLLKNVWIGVLPHNVFTRLMGTLLNMFVEELIHRVCSVEDISMEIATQLSDMYVLVQNKGPLLFLDPGDVHEHVKSWKKLKELIFVLRGSLKDIENHWQDGKGSLSVFKTEELRSLIKALFQNTQIRANLLSKIK